MTAQTLIELAVAGVLAVLVVASLVARQLMKAGYPWADALVIEAVALIGGIGAVQSYTALRWLAQLGDLPEWQAAVAPATVDLFAAVLGLAALSARRRGARDRYADWLALCYSVAAVLANLAAAGFDVSQHDTTGPQVAVVLLAHTAPVVTFLLGSHWLMRRRVETTADPVAEVAAARAELAEAQRALEVERAAAADLRQALEEAQAIDRADVAEDGGQRADSMPARVAAVILLKHHRGRLSDAAVRRLAAQVADLTGVTVERASRVLRAEQARNESHDGRRPRSVQTEAALPVAAAQEG
jgi:hypothetical protein